MNADFIELLHTISRMALSVDNDIKDKHLIVVSLPGDAYYRKNIKDIECFIREMSEKTAGLDDFVVICSNATKKNMKKQCTCSFGNAKFLFVDQSLDLWMRDFCPVLPKAQVKFKYQPKYLKSKDANYVDSEFMKVMTRIGVKLEQVNISLDGGNVVDNNCDKVVISERIFVENKSYGKYLKNDLEDALDAKIAFIPDPEDTTGHSDGIVAFIEEDILLIANDGDEKYYKEVETAVKTTFPNVKTVCLPCGKHNSSGTMFTIINLNINAHNLILHFLDGKKWKGFTTAIGGYVNMLVTTNAVYVPQFNLEESDSKALEIVKSCTQKKVVSINTSNLSHMGGSVRCMSWQMEASHPVAQALYKHWENF